MASAGESALGAIEREVGKLLNVVRWGLSRHVMENVRSARCGAGAGNGLETGGGVQRRKHEPRTRGMHSAFCRCPGGAGTRRHRCLHLCGTAPASGRCAGRRRHATTPWTTPGACMRIHIQLDRSVGADRWLAHGASCCGLELVTRHR